MLRTLALAILLAPALPAQTITLDSISLPGTEVVFTMAQLPGGTFQMGEDGKEIILSPFAISTTEVTHDAYRIFQVRDNDTPEAAEIDWEADAVTRPTPPYLDLTYGMGNRGGYPQVNTTQQAALRYCEWLYQKTGRFFRLPTEAEWEYACLAGNNNPEEMEEYAWLLENGEETYHKVGEKKPNAWGLYDMLGNVSEWTLDQYTEEYPAQLGDPSVDPWVKPTKKHSRTVRGGSFDTYTEEVGCRVREKSSPRWQARDPQIPKSKWWNVDAAFLGFRVVSPAEQPGSEEVSIFFAEAIID